MKDKDRPKKPSSGKDRPIKWRLDFSRNAGTIPPPPVKPDFFSPQWQEKTSLRARANGSLTLRELVYIMAYDERCNDVLWQLWDRLGLKETPRLASFPIDIDSLKNNEHRAEAWGFLWDRMARTDMGQFLFSHKEEWAPIPLYADVLCEKKIGTDSEERCGDYFIKLEDLKEYLEKTIGIPVPQALLPTDTKVNEPEKADTHQEAPKQEDAITEDGYSDLISGVKVSLDEDRPGEIKIQVGPGKPWKNINRDTLEFKRADKNVTWKDFLFILESPEHIYPVGTSSKNRKDYDRNRQRLNSINAKPGGVKVVVTRSIGHAANNCWA